MLKSLAVLNYPLPSIFLYISNTIIVTKTCIVSGFRESGMCARHAINYDRYFKKIQIASAF
jgi:hypothetical protein